MSLLRIYLLCCNAHDGGTRNVLYDGHIKHERLMVHVAEARGLDGAQSVTIKLTSISWEMQYMLGINQSIKVTHTCWISNQFIHLRRKKKVSQSGGGQYRWCSMQDWWIPVMTSRWCHVGSPHAPGNRTSKQWGQQTRILLTTTDCRVVEVVEEEVAEQNLSTRLENSPEFSNNSVWLWHCA